MNSQLIPFNFDDSLIRSTVVEDKPWFVAKDICAVLEHTNSRRAVDMHCRPKGVTSRYTLTGGGEQQVTFIDQGNVLRLITRSRLPAAERFESWLFDEMLPELFHTGSYSLANQSEKRRLEENKALHRNIDTAHKLTERIRREPNEELREALYVQFQAVHQAMAIDPPSLEAISTNPRQGNGPVPPASQAILDDLWETIEYLEHIGATINHASDSSRLAINLPHLASVATAYKVKLPPRSELRRALRDSQSPRFAANTSIYSVIMRRTTRCWVCERETSVK